MLIMFSCSAHVVCYDITTMDCRAHELDERVVVTQTSSFDIRTMSVHSVSGILIPSVSSYGPKFIFVTCTQNDLSYTEFVR